ncbi:phage tail protein [Superficieibacter sp. BNK-5]|uniref:phage tail-collar fiber domain-containing protein n=1 Tax=Superficieibacter sp. BNK-5 TaxID=3376142 RepID=UPI0039BFFD98
MASEFFTILTTAGKSKIAAALAEQKQICLQTMVVGDGNGKYVEPQESQTKVVHEVWRGQLNTLKIAPDNPAWVIAEAVLPEAVGGWYIREVGLLDVDGTLIAIGKFPETYKPLLPAGASKQIVIRAVMEVTNAAAVTLMVDPSIVLATREYVDQTMAEHIAAADPHSQYLIEAEIDKYIPVGLPLPWPQAIPPEGWLKCNGAVFDKNKYPKLALAYPSGTLPDLRGEFLRGWDDGRGVDLWRSVLSAQPDAFASHNHSIRTTASLTTINDDGDPVRGEIRGSINTQGTLGENKVIGMFGGNETRPRNIAFNFIVRVA